MRQQYAAARCGGAGGAGRERYPLSKRSRRKNDGGPECSSRNLQQRLEAVNRYVESYRRYCWPVHVGARSEACAVSSAGHRRPGARRARSCLAHGNAGPRSAKSATDCCWRLRTRSVDVTDPASVEEATRMVGRIDRPRRRRHGGEAARFRRAWTAWAGAAGGQVPRPRVFEDHLRPRIFAAGKSEPVAAVATWRPSGRWRFASLRWALRRWNGSSDVSRCAECMSASLAFWRWKANRSILGCRVRGGCRSFGFSDQLSARQTQNQKQMAQLKLAATDASTLPRF